MTNTTTIPFADGSIFGQRAIAHSDGGNGYKQYVVTVRVTTNGNFIVTKYWGKDGQSMFSLRSQIVGEFDTYLTAKNRAKMTMWAKTDGKYQLTEEYEQKLVSA